MARGCRYDSAGPWAGGAHCSGTFLPGTKAAGEAMVTKFGGYFQGYACRPNTADEDELSVHGTGRAWDWFAPGPVGSAEQIRIGTEGARWLAENHEEFGVQLVIWRYEDWSCSHLDDVPAAGRGPGWTSYGGPNPHIDHVHGELTIEAANNNTAATYEGGLTVADIRDLLDAEQDTRRFLAGVVLRNTQKVLRSEQRTRQRLVDAGVIPAQAGQDSDLEADLAEIKAQLAALGD